MAAPIPKGFVCKESWTDDKGRHRSKVWGRRYHARSAAEAMVEEVKKHTAGVNAKNHQVVVAEVYEA